MPKFVIVYEEEYAPEVHDGVALIEAETPAEARALFDSNKEGLMLPPGLTMTITKVFAIDATPSDTPPPSEPTA